MGVLASSHPPPPPVVPVLDDPGPCSVVSFCCGMEMLKDGGEREGLGGGDG